MTWSLSLIFNSVLLGVGLAMDAFSVSLADGLQDPSMKKSKMTLIGGTFGLFQAVMPLIGWICVHTIVEHFRAFETFIPWIALVLLLFIGGKMIYEGIKDKGGEDNEVAKLSHGALFFQAIATSIDALSVGFTIAEYSVLQALFSVVIIGIVTFVISLIGLFLGKKIGTKLSGKALILGGVILVGIGIKIFVSGVLQ